MSDDRDPLAILGTTLEEKYRIEALAGMGGFSAVYRAQHVVWNEPVAIKFFTMLEDAKPELREQLLQDFIQEGKLMSQLSSRSAAIVQARDMGKLKLEGSDDWIPYMVLEWIEGTPLDAVISQERRAGLPPRSLAEVMTLLEPGAIALDVAHRGNVAHRDLKPANFVILGDPRDPESGLKVLDFGIAKVMEGQAALQEQLQLTGQHITAFTPNYGAPEQFSRNFGATGPWTDVFAMALIVIELLQGARVLNGDSFFELGVASCDADSRPTPRALDIEVSDEVETVLAKALAVDPKARHPHMGAFWRELHRAAFPEAETWSPRTNKPSVPSLTGPTTAPPARVVTPPRESHPDTVAALALAGGGQRRRRPILWAATAVAVASLGVLVVGVGWRRSAPPPAAESATTSAPTASDAASTSPGTASDGAESAPPASGAVPPAPSSDPTATASATASAIASAPLPPSGRFPPMAGVPKSTPPAQPSQKTEPPVPAPGSDPWDPSSFGGRR